MKNTYSEKIKDNVKGVDIKQKFEQYKENFERAEEYFEKNFEKIKSLFENEKINSFIFEPFKDVFTTPLKTIDKDIYLVITQVALINMVLAGLPGKMGIGIYVSMALEAYMAYKIATHFGIKIEKPKDIFKYFSILSATATMILWGFKELISLGFSLFSVIPGVNPLIISELLVTNFIGILFYIGFSEASKTGSFSIPKRMIAQLLKQTKDLFTYQFKTLKKVLTPANIKLFGSRLKQWATGSIVAENKVLNGELFASAAMFYLIEGEYDKLNGPLGDIFIEAIRLRWSAQLGEDASLEEIAQRFSEYDSEALIGATNTIKGKMFELMVEKYENEDDDNWKADLFENETHPDSDITFYNTETNEYIDVSLKATNNTSIIENALQRYPDTIIMTTDEMAQIYGDDSRVIGSGILDEKLANITEENLEDLVNSIEPISNSMQVVVGGTVMGAIAAIWPFTIAYGRKKISYSQYESALKAILPESGVSLASRLSYLVALGPIFAWYLLARGVGNAVKAIDTIEDRKILTQK